MFVLRLSVVPYELSGGTHMDVIRLNCGVALRHAGGLLRHRLVAHSNSGHDCRRLRDEPALDNLGRYKRLERSDWS